ncbi:hypothetical protein FRC03_011952 [Tulasnella sp. 419]|nr:hypothetical protein FRC03_011952 [Tulasnella sp. 419]
MEIDNHNDDTPFLDTVQGEISLFRSITRARPVGLHKYFHLIAIINNIKHETGRTVHSDEVWEKLKALYNLESLDALDLSDDDEFDDNVNIQVNPYFESEFSLPYTQYEPLIAPRRVEPTTGSGHSRTDSGASALPTPARKVSANIAAFDSDGELTEEEDNKGEADEGGTTGEDQEAGEPSSPRGRRRRSRSIRTRSEGHSVPPEDTEMAEPEASPAPSVTGSRQSRRTTTAKQKKPPPPPPQRKGPSVTTRKKKK